MTKMALGSICYTGKWTLPLRCCSRPRPELRPDRLHHRMTAAPLRKGSSSTFPIPSITKYPFSHCQPLFSILGNFYFSRTITLRHLTKHVSSPTIAVRKKCPHSTIRICRWPSAGWEASVDVELFVFVVFLPFGGDVSAISRSRSDTTWQYVRVMQHQQSCSLC